MKRAALFLLVALTADAGGGRFDRFNSRCAGGRSSRGLGCDDLAFFEFAPANGAGMGAACACTTPTGAKGETLTFSRASVAECYSNDGQTLTQCASNQPLVSSGRVDSTLVGLWREETRTNLILHNRDLSQAIWTKTNMACPRTATGMRNDVNGASTCTSSAGNGTVIQATVTGAATRSTSLHIKRRTGTGGVDVTRDNGATWTSITSRLSDTLWRRVVPYPTAGCVGGNCIVVPQMVSAIANPTIGIRLVMSGDAVDVDFVQDENGDGATSPILTAGASANRAVDSATFSYTNSVGCLGARITGATTTTTYGLMVYETGNKFALLGYGVRGATLESSVSAQWYQNPTNPIVNNTFATPYGGSIYYQASQPSTTLTRSCLSGLCSQTATAALTYTSAAHTVYLGTTQGNSAHVNGVISQVVVDPSPSRCPENYPSQNLSIAWLGDSIIAGTGSTPNTPPMQLKTVTDPGSVFNLATGGYTTTQCATRYTSATVAGGGHRTLIWSCGVNDMATGVSGATAWANAQAVVAAARAAGLKVIITSIMPWKNSAGWTAGKQTETAAYNAAASAWASANGALYVDLFTPMGGGGGDPDVLAVAYDSGDLIHPNATGAGIIASLVGAQNP